MSNLWKMRIVMGTIVMAMLGYLIFLGIDTIAMMRSAQPTVLPPTFAQVVDREETPVLISNLGEHVAALSSDGTLVTQSGEELSGYVGGKKEWAMKCGGAERMVFSTDGKTLAISNGWRVYTVKFPEREWGGATQECRQNPIIVDLHWVSETELVYTRLTGGATRWSATGEKPEKRYALSGGIMSDSSMTKDGRMIAHGSGRRNPRLYRLDAKEGEKKVELPGSSEERKEWDVTISPDGKILAVVENEAKIIRLLRVDDNFSEAARWSTEGGVRAVAFSAGAKTLATVNRGHTVKLYDLTAPESPPDTTVVDGVKSLKDGVSLEFGGNILAVYGRKETVLLKLKDKK